MKVLRARTLPLVSESSGNIVRMSPNALWNTARRRARGDMRKAGKEYMRLMRRNEYFDLYRSKTIEQ